MGKVLWFREYQQQWEPKEPSELENALLRYYALTEEFDRKHNVSRENPGSIQDGVRHARIAWKVLVVPYLAGRSAEEALQAKLWAGAEVEGNRREVEVPPDLREVVLAEYRGRRNRALFDDVRRRR